MYRLSMSPYKECDITSKQLYHSIHTHRIKSNKVIRLFEYYNEYNFYVLHLRFGFVCNKRTEWITNNYMPTSAAIAIVYFNQNRIVLFPFRFWLRHEFIMIRIHWQYITFSENQDQFSLLEPSPYGITFSHFFLVILKHL